MKDFHASDVNKMYKTTFVLSYCVWVCVIVWLKIDLRDDVRRDHLAKNELISEEISTFLGQKRPLFRSEEILVYKWITRR